MDTIVRSVDLNARYKYRFQQESEAQVLTIDGSVGEGGGQILRTSLALSLCLNTPIRMVNIRQARSKPGLRPQHLAAVKAAAAISNAEVEGASLGSRALVFIPSEITADRYRFDVGTAGSTTLVLQTILMPLCMQSRPSHLILEGGTHNPLAPSFDFLSLVYLPLIKRMGPRINARLLRPGFFPAGGGRVKITISPAAPLQPLRLPQRGTIQNLRAEAVIAKLPQHIAQRELDVIGSGLGIEPAALAIHRLDSAYGPGNAVTVIVEGSHITEAFTGFGKRGIRAEIVAEQVVSEVRRYLDAGVPVGRYLADQLLLPIALAGSGSYVTLCPSLHTKTSMDIIRKFMDSRITQEQVDTDSWRITVG